MRRAMVRLFFVFAFVPFVIWEGSAIAVDRTSQRTSEVEVEISQLIQQMTLEEKVSLLGGTGFDTRPLPRLGIPSIRMTDGPVGVRGGEATAFPSGISMAATFNSRLIHDVAQAIADEARFKGKNMLLGPCVNINRHPFGGRNFESFGEDPLVASILGAEYVRGIQSRGVLASVKHFAVNDQEHERLTINVNVDKRTLFEMHLPAFKAAVDAGSWTVMSAYNKVNGPHATQNSFLQNQVLKEMWGFQGFVVSDWDATHSTVEAANNGLDLEMPYATWFDDKLVAAVRAGRVKETTIDDKVRRLLRAMYGIGIMGQASRDPIPAPNGPGSAENTEQALKVAQESLVLLKNDQALLPIRTEQVRRVALIGPNANIARIGGGGSSAVIPISVTTPLRSLQELLPSSVEVLHAVGAPFPGDADTIPSEYLKPHAQSSRRGLKAEYFDNRDLAGSPVLTRVEETIDLREAPVAGLTENFSARWSGYLTVPTAGNYKLSTLSDDGVRLFLDGKELISDWEDQGNAANEVAVELEAGRAYALRIEYYQGEGGFKMRAGFGAPAQALLAEALNAARQADVVVVFTGLGTTMEGEGYDRPRFDFPKEQVELIRAVARTNPNTAVVLTSGNPLPMGEWVGEVKTVVQAWYAGQEGGRAIADLLVGKINPSGKLPVTFLKRWEDSPAFGNYPGSNGQVHYREGIFVGYRHFDAKKVEPEFPFGHGLSYTRFEFADPKVSILNASASKPDIRVAFRLANVGSSDGAEVAQIYVGEKQPRLARPVRELKAFKKVFLKAGETQIVQLSLDSSAFAYFDEAAMKWRVDPGAFEITIGSSSRDLRLRSTIELMP